ncbi:replication protein [Bacillus sp. FJAT-18017]|uniref:conserved phage C-terminal domain-containing protein n=1 Tax=Bacillus sp. FJAT-18017 TaxID=1705566 RepID=UPI0006AF7494|nr:conserved phage C-terminal domain-containing protein [Bacillus sp. FJAT-18017]ALC91578.1 replication protein [Bacillus sp. FJAT-18017]
MSNLLISERPMMVIPALAVKIGLNEAIVLQQIHYWLKKKLHVIEGRSWVYNTYKEWNQQLPFWSESTIKRVFKTLEDLGYVLSGNFNRSKLDQTKWYTIDYEKLKELDEGESITEEILPETDVQEKQEMEKIPVAEVVEYLNEKTNSSYKVGTGKTRKLITSRWKEGFRLSDFTTVIDKKADEWLDHPKWSRYLRPETLFGPKFESYLNEKTAKTKLREEDFRFDDET